jgi:Ca-activated chloride channel family protein
MSLRKFGFLLSLLLMFCWTLSPSGRLAASRQDPAAINVDVNLVNVFLTVQNPKGEFVSGLSRDDFKIYEDDVEQKISVFEKDAVDSSFGILIDNSGSMVDTLPVVKSGVLDFVGKRRQTDEFFVMTFGRSVQTVLDVRQSVQTLESVLKTVTPEGTSKFYEALIAGMNKVSRSNRERKALIVFTDGSDNGNNSVTFGAVRLKAQQTGVLLYFIPIGSLILIDQPVIRDLSELSGGRVIHLDRSAPIRPAMESIRTDLAQQYYLGYYAPLRPGYHRIRVEVPKRDVRIRAKPGYAGS